MKKDYEPKMKKVKVVQMVRINTRIRQDQQKYIKSQANKNPKRTEGEVFRDMLDMVIKA